MLEEKARWQQLLSGKVDGQLEGAIKTLKSLDPADLEPGPDAKETKVEKADPYHEIKENGMQKTIFNSS